MIFTEGTIIMHKGAICHSRAEIIQQVEEKEKTVGDYASYIPISDSVRKLNSWAKEGAEIIYLTSRKKEGEIQMIQKVLTKHSFPKGLLLFRHPGEEYKDIAEKNVPDVLVEDDCESVGGPDEMTVTHIKASIKCRIKSITVKEFGGIDHLPDKVSSLLSRPYFRMQ
jgi:hypothetical protein